jgi:hypothetical protein
VLGGVPLGLAVLAWLYAGAPAVGAEWRLLHANLQIFGFFGTLIVGVAHHLFARFTGRVTARSVLTRLVLGLLSAALALRVAGTWGGLTAAVLAASALQALAFLLFAAWVWRFLEGRALSWPRLRVVAFGALAAGVLLRTAETLLAYGWAWPAPAVALSGLFVWVALLCAATNLLGAVVRRS